MLPRDKLIAQIERAVRIKTNIDITSTDQFGRGQLFIGTQHSDYSTIRYKNISIFDRYGDVMKKYNLYMLPQTGELDIKITEKGPNKYIRISIQSNTDFNALLEEVKKGYDYITILCDNYYIPPVIFENINSYELTLHDPRLDEDVISSIRCYSVIIDNASYYPSFESLKCEVFSLSYNLESYFNNETEEEYTPIMPETAYDVTLDIASSSEHRNVLFLGNDSIKKLNIKVRYEGNVRDIVFINLGYLSGLKSLTSSTGVVLSYELMEQLTELRLVDKSQKFANAVNITDIDGTIYIYRSFWSFGREHPNVSAKFDKLTTLQANFMTDETFGLFPNLKKLMTGMRIDAEYIPKKLEELVFSASDPLYDEDEFAEYSQEFVDFSKYLMGMKSIKRMPLFLFITDYDYPIDNAGDVYYDIFVEKHSEIVPLIRARGISGISQLRDALSNNRNYETKHKTLESLHL